MAIIGFNNQVLSAFGQTPSNLSWSLSSSGPYKTVELLTTGTGALSNPSLSSKQVRGVVFNTFVSSTTAIPTSGTGAFVTLSAFSGTTFRVDRAYNNATMGVIYTDGSSTLFTCTTGTALQSLTANGFDTVYPEVRRMFVLGYK